MEVSGGRGTREVFPAYAGMSLEHIPAVDKDEGFPRLRGDEPLALPGHE